MGNAEFLIVEDKEDYVFIIDTGHYKNKSITNDAEFIIKNLYDEFDLYDKRVFYLDSEGDIDELLHDRDRFIDFKAGHEGVELPELRKWILSQVENMDEPDIQKLFEFMFDEILHEDKQKILWKYICDHS